MPNPENLKPVKPGQVLNPNGRPKGSKNLSTIVRELEAEDFDWSLMPVKQKDAVQKVGSPWRAIVFTAVGKALDGDVQAMKWLKEAGYGNQVDITSGGKVIKGALIGFADDPQAEATDTDVSS